MKHLIQPSKLLKPASLALAIIAVFATAAFTPIKPTLVVVLDAGHGGKDPGNLGTGRYSLTEKDVTLAVTNKLAAYIEENMPDVKVILTRKDDSFPKLSTRVNIANESEADVFISVHCDAFSSASASGSGTYVMGMHKTEASLRSAMRENASIYKAKYSAGPNKNATLAKIGARIINPTVARSAPTNDATPDNTRASPALPCFAIGYPSNVVIIAGSSPGIFNKIEEILPPYIAP